VGLGALPSSSSRVPCKFLLNLIVFRILKWLFAFYGSAL
jgi:hypothetical protein